jgi:hypothetical protein
MDATLIKKKVRWIWSKYKVKWMLPYFLNVRSEVEIMLINIIFNPI